MFPCMPFLVGIIALISAALIYVVFLTRVIY